MNKNNSTTFNGSTTGTITYPYKNQLINDPIVYCPFCGKHLPTSTEAKYCSFCGKELPRTYTGGSYIIHWNYGTGEPSWPKPETIC